MRPPPLLLNRMCFTWNTRYRQLRVSKGLPADPGQDVRAQDEKRDAYRPQGRDEHTPCRYILGLFDQRVEIRRGHVGEEFEGRIECLGGPDGHNGQHDPAPLSSGKDE